MHLKIPCYPRPSLKRSQAHSEQKPNLHGSMDFKLVVQNVRQRWQSYLRCTTIEVQMYTSYKCNAIVNASHKEDNPTWDQPAFRRNVMNLQQKTASCGCKVQMWFNSAILIPLCVSSPASLSQPSSLHYYISSKKHHQQHIAFIQMSVSEHITVWSRFPFV